MKKMYRVIVHYETELEAKNKTNAKWKGLLQFIDKVEYTDYINQVKEVSVVEIRDKIIITKIKVSNTVLEDVDLPQIDKILNKENV